MRRTFPLAACFRCHYSFAGLSGVDVCPECGLAFNESNKQTLYLLAAFAPPSPVLTLLWMVACASGVAATVLLGGAATGSFAIAQFTGGAGVGANPAAAALCSVAAGCFLAIRICWVILNRRLAWWLAIHQMSPVQTFAVGRLLVAILLFPAIFFPVVLPFVVLMGIPLSATGAFFEQVMLGRAAALAGRPGLSIWPALAGGVAVFLWLGLGCLGPIMIAGGFALDAVASVVVIRAVTNALAPALSWDDEEMPPG